VHLAAAYNLRLLVTFLRFGPCIVNKVIDAQHANDALVLLVRGQIRVPENDGD